MPVSGQLVALVRAMTPVRFRDDAAEQDDKWQAETELFALQVTTAVVGVALGLLVIQVASGTQFAIAFTIYASALGLMVGIGLPLQLLAWGRLNRGSLRQFAWRFGCPGAGALLAATVAAIGMR